MSVVEIDANNSSTTTHTNDQEESTFTKRRIKSKHAIDENHKQAETKSQGRFIDIYFKKMENKNFRIIFANGIKSFSNFYPCDLI